MPETYRRGHVQWHTREATVWHALPDESTEALCGRNCKTYLGAVFDPDHPHSCIACVTLADPLAQFRALRGATDAI